MTIFSDAEGNRRNFKFTPLEFGLNTLEVLFYQSLSSLQF